MPTEPCPERKNDAEDQKIPRTLDERQIEEDVPELEERESGHAPLWYEQEVPPAYLMRDEEIVRTDQVAQVVLARRPERDDLPYEGLVTAGEFILCAIVFSTTLWLTWWAFGHFTDLLGTAKVLAEHRMSASPVTSLMVSALIWLTNRAKRLSRARHLRGELKT